MRTHDGKTDTQTKATDSRYERKADAIRHTNGKHDPVHLCFGYGRGVHPWIVGQGSGQRRDIQNDFTRFFYSYRRHDWIPEWYQTHAE